MAYRERNNVVSITTPSQFQRLGKEIESTMWIQSQLLQLERNRTCKRVESLRSQLQAELDIDPFLNEEALDQKLIRLERELYDMTGEYQRIKEQLHNSELSQCDTPDTGLRKRWIVAGIIIVLIIVYQVIHNS